MLSDAPDRTGSRVYLGGIILSGGNIPITMVRFFRSRMFRQFMVVGSLLISRSSTAQLLFNRSFQFEDYMGNLAPVSGPSGFLICSTIRYGTGNIDGFQFTRFDSTGSVVLTRGFSAGSLVNVMQFGALARTHSDGTYSFLFGNYPYNGTGGALRVFNTTSLGGMNWNRKISFADTDRSFEFVGAMDQAFEETPDGGYLITGLGRTSTASAPAIMKLDGSGNILWSKTYQLDRPSAWHIISSVDHDGVSLLGFHADSTPEVVSSNCILTRVAPNGNTLWSKRTDGFRGRFSGCVRVDGRYVISAMDSTSFYVLEVDTTGVPLWGKRYTMTTTTPSWSTAIIPTHDGGFILVSEASQDGDGSDVFLFKVDFAGTVKWERAYGHENFEWPIDLDENSDGTLTLLTGAQSIQNWNVFYYLSRLDSTGMNDCMDPVEGWLTETTFPFSLSDVTLDEFESPMLSQPLYMNDSLSTDPVMEVRCADEVGLVDRARTEGLLIYPDPSDGLVTVRTDGITIGGEFDLFDVFGKEVKRIKLSSQETVLDLSSLPRAAYVYRLRLPEGKMISGRLVRD